MKVIDTKFADVKIIQPNVLADARGYFLESFNQSAFDEALGIHPIFVQDNRSRSLKGVLRGLHYQVAPKSQGKLISVTSGEILDVIVDLRKSSPDFGQWMSVVLSSENHHQLWVPQGFAHGFAVLSERADCVYKVTDYYCQNSERSIAWDDPDLNIDWRGLIKPIISEKDRIATPFAKAEYL
ncbi:MAG: dTDP-4-dehydrorhamnose 3,5-epimerase [Proteobacteria bacterium]|nr:MAG: dTDP-4-dehydrorhamnose 3,5-epimerase [Pseudomonadota bacterium]